MNKKEIEALAEMLEAKNYEGATNEVPLFRSQELRAIDAVLDMAVSHTSPLERAVALVALMDIDELEDYYYQRLCDKAGDDRE